VTGGPPQDGVISAPFFTVVGDGVVSRPFCTFVGDGVGVVVPVSVPFGAALLMDLEAVWEGVTVVSGLLGGGFPPLPPEAGSGFPSFVTVNWNQPRESVRV